MCCFNKDILIHNLLARQYVYERERRYLYLFFKCFRIALSIRGLRMSDTELVGCPICKGRKTLVGLGHIPIDCHQCNGIGWIEKVCEKAENDFLNGLKDIDNSNPEEFGLNVAKKKSGRPKKAG